MADAKPQVLILQLGDQMQLGLFEDIYSGLRMKVEAHYEVVKKTTAATAIECLSQPNLQLKAVLVVDGGLAKQKFKKVQVKLASYAKGGGTVILCCNFSSFVSGPDFVAMAGNMGLQWEWGDYHRTDFALNPAFESVFGSEAFATLERAYSMKTVHLKDVDAGAKIYVPTDESRTQSAVFLPSRADRAQCPAVLQNHGDGFVGFIGDVNNETGSQALLMAMLSNCFGGGYCGFRLNALGTAADCAPRESKADASSPSSVTAGGCVVCGETAPVKRCADCKNVQYCSLTCQKEDWRVHKHGCRKVC